MKQRQEGAETIKKMSEGGVSPQPPQLPVRKNSIHHFHVLMSWLRLAMARNVAMMTPRIDEVQVGVGCGSGFEVEMVKPDVAEVGLWMD